MNVVLNFLLLLCYCQFLSLCLLLFIHIYLCVSMLDCETESEKGFPGGSASKESACNAGDLGLIPGLGRFPWRRERLPTPVFWPGEFHLLYSPWGHKESDMTERLPRPLHFMQT